jgi:hypothetical protein
VGRVAARAGNGLTGGRRRIVAQQLGERGRPGLVHGGSQSGLQVESALSAPLLKHHPQEAV